MRRFLLLLVLTMVAMRGLAQSSTATSTPTSTQAGDLAQGAEKAAHEQAHPGEEHGEEGEAPKTYFGIPAWILKTINMIAFIAALGYLLKGPIKGAFAARGEGIRKAADEASQRRAKADQLASDIQARLSSIEGEVRAIHERAQQEGERQKRELIVAAEAEAAKILQAARNEVDNRLKSARHELTEYAGQLASDRAESILRDKITEEDRHKLFEDSLRAVGEAQS